MNKVIAKLSFVVFMAFLLFSCVAQEPAKPFPEFSQWTFSSDEYDSSIDKFLIIVDASSSMGETYNGNVKFDTAKEILNRLNQTLPELGQIAGVRTFGHSDKVTKSLTLLPYGMDNYNTQNLTDGFSAISKPGGTTPMYKAFEAAQDDLAGTTGKTTLVIISDAKDLKPNTVSYAQALKDQFGPNVCFYPILVGDDPSGKAFMEQLANIGNCGFFSTSDELLAGHGMSNFVEAAFLKEKPVMQADSGSDMDKDSDGDGVPDVLDKCPGTPYGTKVTSYGCPYITEAAPAKDSDGDGVLDASDACPGTPKGAKVNAQGCWILGAVLFDFDKATLKSEAFAELNSVVSVLEINPGVKLNIEGHTDNVGTADYNMKLSLRRALVVKTYLSNMGIDDSRLTYEGFGFTRPTATNKTKQGRAWNRRVELTPVY